MFDILKDWIADNQAAAAAGAAGLVIFIALFTSRNKSQSARGVKGYTPGRPQSAVKSTTKARWRLGFAVLGLALLGTAVALPLSGVHSSPTAREISASASMKKELSLMAGKGRHNRRSRKPKGQRQAAAAAADSSTTSP